MGAASLADMSKITGGLHKYYEGKAVTVVHGDCRPGNMLFARTSAVDAIPTDQRPWSPGTGVLDLAEVLASAATASRCALGRSWCCALRCVGRLRTPGTSGA